MLKYTITFIFILNLFVFNIATATSQNNHYNLAGKVIALRGQVTILSPGRHIVDRLKKGDQVMEDSSILTQEKSFTKIKLSNGSIITIGPKSKIIVSNAPKEGPSFFSLLKGSLRAKVHKRNSKHFYIKTRSAAMGVRGTEFVTSYNTLNHKTSLLTFKGSVAIQSINPKVNSHPIILTKSKNIASLLKKQSVLTNIGSFVTINKDQVTMPKMISVNKEQFIRMKLDHTMGTSKLQVSKKMLKTEMNKMKEMKHYGIKGKNREGFVSIKTCLFIPTTNDGKEIGTVASNGAYIPPKNLKLDANYGFVSTNHKNFKKAKRMNQRIKNQVQKTPNHPGYKRYFK